MHYIYKHEGKAYACADDLTRGFMMIGDHKVAAEIINGDDFEDGEEISREYLVELEEEDILARMLRAVLTGEGHDDIPLPRMKMIKS